MSNVKKSEGSPKFISEDCPKNCFGKLSNSSCRRMSNDCFEELSNNSPRRLSNGILSEIYNVFSKTKTFCFENSVFSHLVYACVR